MHSHIIKSGNSLAVRIPAKTATKLHLKLNTPVALSDDEGVLTIKRAAPHYTLEELLAQCKEPYGPEEIWGAPMGDEVW